MDHITIILIQNFKKYLWKILKQQQQQPNKTDSEEFVQKFKEQRTNSSIVDDMICYDIRPFYRHNFNVQHDNVNLFAFCLPYHSKAHSSANKKN
ncbi:hypothetical protein BLOT_007062 [Blomia tropicalis]|nr:hypothetical protein BLOT_007062 [Blomia tropicalis]